MAEGDEAKTTCVTRYESFEFLVMPFELTNAPATLCNLMNDVIFEFLDSFIVVYLDDIVIYILTLEDHLVHLKNVFDRLRQDMLHVKKEKYKFAQPRLSSWVTDFQVPNLDGCCKGNNNLRMAYPYYGDKTSIISWFDKLL